MFATLIEAAGVPLTQRVRDLIDSLRLPGQRPRGDDEDSRCTSLLDLARKCRAGRLTPNDFLYGTNEYEPVCIGNALLTIVFLFDRSDKELYKSETQNASRPEFRINLQIWMDHGRI